MPSDREYLDALKVVPREVRIGLLYLRDKMDAMSSTSVKISDAEKKAALAECTNLVNALTHRVEVWQGSTENQLTSLRLNMKELSEEVKKQEVDNRGFGELIGILLAHVAPEALVSINESARKLGIKMPGAEAKRIELHREYKSAAQYFTNDLIETASRTWREFGQTFHKLIESFHKSFHNTVTDKSPEGCGSLISALVEWFGALGMRVSTDFPPLNDMLNANPATLEKIFEDACAKLGYNLDTLVVRTEYRPLTGEEERDEKEKVLVYFHKNGILTYDTHYIMPTQLP